MTERESAHPPPARIEGDPTDKSDISDKSDTQSDTQIPDKLEAPEEGEMKEPRDRLLPQRAGPDGEDRKDDDDEGEGEKRTVAHVSISDD